MPAVRRLFGWLAGLAGIAALARILARRRHAPAATPAPPLEPDPAAELRRKLSESRSEPPEPTAPEPDEPQKTLDERRARVHAKAMQAIEEMKEPDA